MKKENKAKDIYVFYRLIAFWSISTIKKIQIISYLLLYLIVLFFMVIVVPLINKETTDVLFIIKNPIASSILVFICSIMIVTIANQIFKSSIEDGIEILLLSKSINKRMLFLSKLTSFSIFVLFISIVSAIIVSFVSLINDVTNYEIYSVVFGVLTATMINGLLFGGLTLIFVCYFKKITITLVMFFINFVLCILSVLVAFKGTNALIINGKQNKNEQIEYVEIALQNNNDNKFIGGIINKDYQKNPNNNLDPKDLYNKYQNNSSLYTFSNINLYGQLSNMYTLNSGYYNPLMYFQRSNKMVENNKLNFLPKTNTTSITMNMDFLTNLIDLNNIKYPMTINVGHYYRYGSNSFEILDKEYNTEVVNIQKLNDSKIDNSLFNYYWSKYESEITDEYNEMILLVNQNKMSKWDIRTPLSLLLYRIANEIKLNKSNYLEFNKITNDIILSAYYELLNVLNNQEFDIFNVVDFFNVENSINILDGNDINNITINDVFDNYNNWSNLSKNKFTNLINQGNSNPININENTLFIDIQKQVNNPKNELKKLLLIKLQNKVKYITLLNAVGMELEKQIDFVNLNNLIPNSYNYMFDKFFNTDQYDEIYVPKKYNDGIKQYKMYQLKDYSIYGYWTYLGLINSNLYNNFYPVEIVSLYNSKLIYSLYSLIALVLITIGFAIYMKKDFY